MFNLADRSNELCRFLNDHVLSDFDAQICVLDLLDAVAACDLVLEEDDEALAFHAYMELIAKQGV